MESMLADPKRSLPTLLAMLALCLVAWPAGVARAQDEPPPDVDRAELDDDDVQDAPYGDDTREDRYDDRDEDGDRVDPEDDDDDDDDIVLSLEAGVIGFFDIEGDISIDGIGRRYASDGKLRIDDDESDHDWEAAPYVRFELDSRWISVRASWWWVSWEGDSIAAIGTTLVQRVDTELDIHQGELQLQLNIVNDEAIRIGPFIGGKVFYFDLDTRGLTIGPGGVTQLRSDDDAWWGAPIVGFDLVLRFLPVVELYGRVGYMDLDIFNSSDYDGELIQVEAGITIYPMGYVEDAPDLGIRLGYVYSDIEAFWDDEDDDDSLAADLALHGAQVGILLRF